MLAIYKIHKNNNASLVCRCKAREGSSYAVHLSTQRTSRHVAITLACKINFSRQYFQYSVILSPAQHEYENRFFPSSTDFPKLYDKGLKINKSGWLYVAFMLKLTNKFIILHAWSVFQGILFTLMYNFKLKIRSFKKKNSKEFYYQVKVCI